MPLTETSRATALAALENERSRIVFCYNKIVGADRQLTAIDAAMAELRAEQEVPGKLETVLRAVAEWQKMQFPHRSAASIAKHLLEEAQELQREPTSEMETADVLLLLAGLADYNGVDLADVARRKLDINKARVWGKPDGHGVVKHIEEQEASVPETTAVRFTIELAEETYEMVHDQALRANLSDEAIADTLIDYGLKYIREKDQRRPG